MHAAEAFPSSRALQSSYGINPMNLDSRLPKRLTVPARHSVSSLHRSSHIHLLMDAYEPVTKIEATSASIPQLRYLSVFKPLCQ